MWKDFFSMTNRESSAILTLLITAFVIFVVINLIPDDDFSDISRSDIEKFKQEIKRHESSLRRKPRPGYIKQFRDNHTETPVILSEFDPNTADSVSLRKLGFEAFHVRMILRYRQKGGKFRRPEDISRIPYLDKALAERLIPYVTINPAFAARNDTLQSRPKPVYEKQFKYSEGTHIDVATADTSELKKVPGIGSGMAAAIVNYRNRLGGFYTTEQLKEIRCIDEKCFAALGKFLVVNSPVITRIPVNKAGIEKLNSHPYINFYQARAIVELRKKKGNLRSLKELSLFEEFSEKDLNRLACYLDFSL